MHFQLRKCLTCNRYTMRRQCPKCNQETVSAHPPKFSPDDKYLKYRLAKKYDTMD